MDFIINNYYIFSKDLYSYKLYFIILYYLILNSLFDLSYIILL